MGGHALGNPGQDLVAVRLAGPVAGDRDRDLTALLVRAPDHGGVGDGRVATSASGSAGAT